MTEVDTDVRHFAPAQYMPDLEAAIAAISTEFGPIGAERVVTKIMVNSFAGVTGDENPLHVDPTAAQIGPFGACVSHGLLLLSLATGYVRPESPFTMEKRLPILSGFSSIEFVRPVRVGETICARERVVKAEYVRRKGGIVVVSDFEIINTTLIPYKVVVRGQISIVYT